MMALSRLPSGRRASTMGLDFVDAPPDSPRHALYDFHQVVEIPKFDRRSFQSSTTFHIDALGTVDENVRHRRIVHQWLERTQSQSFIDQFVDQTIAIDLAQQVGMQIAKMCRSAPQLLADQLRIDRAQHRKVHAADQLLVELRLELLESSLAAGLVNERRSVQGFEHRRFLRACWSDGETLLVKRQRVERDQAPP